MAGKTLALKDKANPRKRTGVFVTRDLAPGIIGLDPLVGGAEMRLFGMRTNERDTWPMTASGWSRTKKGFRYADKTGANGPVTAATLARGKLAVMAKGAGLGYALLGAMPQQGIAVAVVFPGGSTAVCAAFPGAAGVLKKDNPVKGVFVAKNAEAPGTCDAL